MPGLVTFSAIGNRDQNFGLWFRFWRDFRLRKVKVGGEFVDHICEACVHKAFVIFFDVCLLDYLVHFLEQKSRRRDHWFLDVDLTLLYVWLVVIVPLLWGAIATGAQVILVKVVVRQGDFSAQGSIARAQIWLLSCVSTFTTEVGTYRLNA